MSVDESNHAECKTLGMTVTGLLDVTRTCLTHVGVFVPECDSAERCIQRSDRRERHGASQGVTVPGDESDHAECETLGITQTGDVTNLRMIVVTAKGIEACPGQGVTVPSDASAI